jgi:hypothetical protein
MPSCVAERDPRTAIRLAAAPSSCISQPLRRASPRLIFRVIALLFALFAAIAIAEIGLRLCGFGHNYTYPMGSFFEPDSELPPRRLRCYRRAR